MSIEGTCLVRSQEDKLRLGDFVFPYAVSLFDELSDLFHCLDAVKSRHLEICEDVRNALTRLCEL